MIINKAPARWTSRLFNQSARTARSSRRPRSWQQTQKRAYASEGGDHARPTQSRLVGDLPWAVFGSGVLAVGLYYTLPPQIERWNRPKGSGHGGHGHGHDEHGEGSESGREMEAQEGEESGEKGGDEGAEGGEDVSEQSDDSGSEGGEKDTPDTSGDEEKVVDVDTGKNVAGVQFKGPSNAGPDHQQTDTRRSYPDAKGGRKKRIESHYGQKQGVGEDPEQDPEDKDLGASAKAVDDKSKTSMAGKQEGLSNTDTKHSEDVTNSSEKSTKGEGTVETAKLKGTVSPNRPQAENKEARDS